jgi:hypothetical protein
MKASHMIRILRAAIAAFALALGCASASAQSAFPTPGGSYVDGHALMCPNGSTDFQGRQIMVPCGGTSNPVQVNASVTASISGFTPTPSYASGTTSASDQTVSLPTGTEFIIYNTGSNAASFNFGAAATGTMNVIQPGSWQAFAGTGGSALHYIEATGTAGTTTFVVSGGAGLPTGSGGGSGGGGGGTVAQGNAGSNAQAWWARIGDATNGPVAVKPASTAPAATDPAIVAALSPNGNQATAANQASILAAINAGYNGTLQGTQIIPAPNVPYSSCSATITTGGTAQNLPNLGTASAHKFTIVNKDSTSGGGEAVGVNPIGTAALTGSPDTGLLPPPTSANGTGEGSYTGEAPNHTVSVIAATTGHVIQCWYW